MDFQVSRIGSDSELDASLHSDVDSCPLTPLNLVTRVCRRAVTLHEDSKHITMSMYLLQLSTIKCLADLELSQSELILAKSHISKVFGENTTRFELVNTQRALSVVHRAAQASSHFNRPSCHFHTQCPGHLKSKCTCAHLCTN